MSENASAALERRRQNGDVAKSTIADDIRKMRDQFKLAMPQGREADQLVRDALTALRTTRDLGQCDSASVLGGLMTCAQLGLRIGVLGQAWLLPFKEWDAKTRTSNHKAQLIIGYQGYIELAHRSEKVQSVMPRTVYENDEFDIDYGINGTLIHKPARGKRGNPIGYHCISRYSNGGYDFTFMSQEEMEEHRDRFAMAKKKVYQDNKPTGEFTIVGPWRDNFEQMALKTVVRRNVKYMPKSPELYVARIVDGGIRINPSHGVAPEDVTTQPDFIDAEPVDLDDPNPAQAGPLLDNQRTRIQILATELDMDRDAKLAYVSQIVNRKVTTTSELTWAEANDVIARMVSFKKQNGG